MRARCFAAPAGKAKPFQAKKKRAKVRDWPPCDLQSRNRLNPMRYVIALLAIAGIVVSVLALKVHYSNDVAPCSINEKWDCGIVNHSPYAVLYGVPVAAIGVAGYLLIVVLALLCRRGWLLAAVTIGLAFALYLTHIERDVLGVWCLYCAISQAIIAVIMLLVIGWFVWAMRSKTRGTVASRELRS
jgi:uncharacterized membrane protein